MLLCAIAVVTTQLIRFGSAIVPFSLLPGIYVLGTLVFTPLENGFGWMIYILLGLMGVPVFATPPYGGPSYILKPTFGFLLLFISFSFVFLDGTKKKKSKFLLFTFFEFCRGKFTIHTRTCLFVGDYEIHCTSANFIWIYLKNRISTLYRGRYFKGYCCIFNRMESQTIARKIEKKIWKIDSHVTKWYEMRMTTYLKPSLRGIQLFLSWTLWQSHPLASSF